MLTERLQESLTEPYPLHRHKFLVVLRQEVAQDELVGLAQELQALTRRGMVRTRKELLELPHIRCDALRREGQCLTPWIEKLGAELLTKQGESGTQVLPRCRGSVLPPETIRKDLARKGPPGMQSQIGKELRRFTGAKVRDSALWATDA